MGSLASPPPSTTPPLYINLYASFCLREPMHNVNVSNWVECYNPSSNSWRPVSSIPGLIENCILKYFATTSIGDSIYIIGGRLCCQERAQYSDESNDFLEVDIEVFSLVLCYDVRSDEWSKCAPLNEPRYNFACTVCDNKIYVAGAQSKLASARGVSSAEVYDPLLDEWTPLPNMSALRYKCVGLTWQGKIHVVGGFAEKGTSDRVVPPRDNDDIMSLLHLLFFRCIDRSSAEVYDPHSGKWDLVARMWQLDVPPNQIVVVDDRLFSSWDCLKVWKGHIEAYDGKLNIWYIVQGSEQRLVSSPMCILYPNDENWSAMQRLYLTMAPIGTHLYFLVGFRMVGESSKTISTVHSFDTSAIGDAWRSFEPMEEEGERELCSHCCIVQVS